MAPTRGSATVTAPRRRAARLLRDAVDQHAAMVYRVAYRVLQNAADAEDVTQEVFLKLLKLSLPVKSTRRDHCTPPQGTPSQPAIPRPAEVRSWLARVTLNHSLNTLRGEKSRKQREQVWSETRKEETVQPQPGEFEAVRDAVLALPLSLRVPILLHYQEGLKYKEIADALDCPEGTVAKRIHAAKKQLKEKLGSFNLSLVALTTQLHALCQDTELVLPQTLVPSIHARLEQHLAQWSSPASRFGFVGGLPFVGVVALLILCGTAIWWVAGYSDRTHSTASSAGALASQDNIVTQEVAPNALAEAPTAAPTNPPPTSVESLPKANEGAEGSVATPVLCGYVRDLEQQVVESAQIEIMRGDDVFATTTSDKFGYYQFTKLPAEFVGGGAVRGPMPRVVSLGGIQKMAGDSEKNSPQIRQNDAESGDDDSAGAIAIVGGSIFRGDIGDKIGGQIGGSRDAGTGVIRRMNAPQLWSLRVTHDDFVQFHGPGVEVTTTVPGSIQRDIELTPAVRLEGWVFDRNGQPIPLAMVRVIGTVTTFERDAHPVETTDENGFYQFLQLPRGAYLLESSAEGYLPHAFLAQSGEKGTQVYLDRGVVVEFAVVDGNGEISVDADVRWNQPGNPTTYQISNTLGIARFPNVVAGAGTVEVYLGAHKFLSKQIQVPAVDHFSQPLRLDKGYPLVGRVTGFDPEQDASRREVTIYPVSNPKAKSNTEVAADGSFQFEQLPEGEYGLVVRAKSTTWSYSLLAALTLPVNPNSGSCLIDLREYPRCEVSVTVTDTDDNGVQHAYAKIEGGGVTLVHEHLAAATSTLELPSGDYLLELSSWGKKSHRQPLAVRNKDIELRVELEEGTPSAAADPNSSPLAQFLSSKKFALFQKPIPLRLYFEWLDHVGEGRIRLDPEIDIEILNQSVKPSGPMLQETGGLLEEMGLGWEADGQSLWIWQKREK